MGLSLGSKMLDKKAQAQAITAQCRVALKRRNPPAPMVRRIEEGLGFRIVSLGLGVPGFRTDEKTKSQVPNIDIQSAP